MEMGKIYQKQMYESNRFFLAASVVELILVRHGDSLGGIPDSDRRLSDNGIKQVISSSKIHIDVIGGIDAVL